jgi:hypothetical protein
LVVLGFKCLGGNYIMPEAISTEPLAQLLKSIALQKRTGIVYVEQLGEKNPQKGQIYFENGHPQRAQAGQETGLKAFQLINEWKQVTCAFHGMSRPFPLKAETPASEPKTQKGSSARLQSARSPETDKLTRAPETIVTEALKGAKGQSERGNQQFILHGTTLEEYAPEQPARPSRSIQRWTTHLNPQMAVIPARPPVTPRLGPLPGEEALPGRMAIFKARALASTPQIMQTMERRERIVFMLLDGRRTVQDIARLTHQPESEVEETLVHLTKNGYTHYIGG